MQFLTEIEYNPSYRCISSKQRSNNSKSGYKNILDDPYRPRETAKPVALVSYAPEDQDGEERREDQGKSAAGHGSNEGDEVIKVGNSQSNKSCNDMETKQQTITIITLVPWRGKFVHNVFTPTRTGGKIYNKN